MKHLINGRNVTFTAGSEFLVQTGILGGAYRTIRRYTGNLAVAEATYNATHIIPGGKKRLLMPDSSYPVLLTTHTPPPLPTPQAAKPKTPAKKSTKKAA